EIPSGLEPPRPANLEVTVGSTIAVDWTTKKVRALLTATYDDRQEQSARGMLRRLLDNGILRMGDLARGPDGKQLRSYVVGASTHDAMRLRGTASSVLILGRGALG